jgi:aryl-alcohol dehydrogenase-like predicted oxidoreductase
MVYRILGSTGLKVSVVGVGTWQLGGEWGKKFSQDEVNRIFDAARESGITLVDTAECYGDHLSETLVGGAVRKDRERWIIATKFGHRYTTPFEREQLWAPADVQRQLEGSLSALGVDTIDLYQFHSGPNAVFENDALWTMLDKQKKTGKVRHLGISIGNSLGPEDQVRQAQRAREVGVESVQVVYNRLQRRPEESIFPACRRDNLGILARVPLASGFLSGKYREGARFGPDDFRSRKSAKELDAMAAEALKIKAEEVPAGVAMAAWALSWCLRDPAVTAVIPGCKNAQQVTQNANAVSLLAEST